MRPPFLKNYIFTMSSIAIEKNNFNMDEKIDGYKA